MRNDNRHKATKQKSVIMTPDASGRSRKQIKFWLDAVKPEQAAMGKTLDEMRENPKKNFAGFMRDCVRLMLALISGDLSVLVELFPDMVQQIENKATIALQAENARLQERIISLKAANAEAEDYIAELESEQDRYPTPDSSAIQATIKAEFDRLESLIISNGYRPEKPSEQPETSPKPVGLKALGGNAGSTGIGLQGGGLGQIFTSINLPEPDIDDDISLDFTANTDTNANQNLVNSLLGLQK